MVWTQKTLDTLANLRTKVARTYGFDISVDTELQTVVGGLIDDTIDDMNSRLFEFNKKVDTAIALSNGTATYELEAAFYKESLAYLVKTSDSTKLTPLVYLPYTRFAETYSTGLVGSGEPAVYTLRNVEEDGLVTLGPTPNTGVATDYTLTVEYYRRIPKPSAEDPIKAAPELETPLLYGTLKRLAIHLHGPGHPDVAAFQALEEKAINEAAAADKHHPDQQLRFRLPWARSTYRRYRGLYIRVD